MQKTQQVELGDLLVVVMGHGLVLDLVCPVLLTPDDDGDVLGLSRELGDAGLEVLPLLAAGKVAEDGLILNAEVCHLEVRFWHN